MLFEFFNSTAKIMKNRLSEYNKSLFLLLSGSILCKNVKIQIIGTGTSPSVKS